MAADSPESDAITQRERLCTDGAKEIIIISERSIYLSIFSCACFHSTVVCKNTSLDLVLKDGHKSVLHDVNL